MVNINDKYQGYRPKIKDGDIILFRGNSLLSRAIQILDKAYFNHVGVAYWFKGRLMIIDSNAIGVKPDFMSNRIRKYVDFCMIRPIAEKGAIDNALSKVFERAEEGTGYDFIKLINLGGLKLLANILKGRDFKARARGEENRDICSEFVQYYESFIHGEYGHIINITPQDFYDRVNRRYVIYADKG